MNTITYFFCTTFTFVAYSQLTSGLTVDDAIVTIDGKITLTASFCNKFGRTNRFEAFAKSIEIIQPDALWNCVENLEMGLGKNQIKELHPDTFKFNTKTTDLYLHCNKISFISNELFKPLVNLQVLDLSENPLGTIEPILTSGLNILQHLVIQDIELPELDTEVLVEKLPKLNKIWFNHNLIECSVYESLKADLSERNIFSGERTYGCIVRNKTCLTPEEKDIRMHLLKISKRVSLYDEQQKNLNSQILDIIQKTADNIVEIKNHQLQLESKLKHQLNKINETIIAQKQEMVQFKTELSREIKEITEAVKDVKKSLEEFSRTTNDSILILN